MPFILFFVSAMVLTLEILQTKLFAYSLPPGMVFVVLGIALLGFGVSATLLSLRPRVTNEEGQAVLPPPHRVVRWGLLGMAGSIVLSHWVFSKFASDLEFKIGMRQWKTLVTLLALSLTYLCAGAVIAAILSDSRRKVARMYAVNLIGSALGCVVIFFALRPLGADQLLVVVTALTALLGVAVCKTPGGRLAAFAYAIILSAGSFYFRGELYSFPRQKDQQVDLLYQRAEEARAAGDDVKATLTKEFETWDPMGCIEVTGIELEYDASLYGPDIDIIPTKWFSQDAAHGSPLLGVGEDGRAADPVFNRTVYGSAYFRGEEDSDVLVIGLGGAPDVQCALRRGARSVTGVDINRTTIGMVREDFKDYLGDPYGNPGFLSDREDRGLSVPEVRIVRADGRSFVRHDERRYDLVQLSGVDTKHAFAAGNRAVHENYLYTQEAFEDYLRRLTQTGILSVIYAGDEYLHRLTVTAVRALQEAKRQGAPGVSSPERHIITLRQGLIVNLLVKRTPFTPLEIQAFQAWVQAANKHSPTSNTGVFIAPYEALGISVRAPLKIDAIPGAPGGNPVLTALVKGRLEDWLAEYPLDLRAVTDDRPFFFHLFSPETTFASIRYHLASKLQDKLRKNVKAGIDVPGARKAPSNGLYKDHPALRQVVLALLMLGIAAVLTLGPLLWFRLRGNRIGGSITWALFFCAIGLGFILAEVGLIQRYVLFLGNQSYAFAVVIGGLLVAAGLGSFWSGRYAEAPLRAIGIAVMTILLALTLHHVALDRLFDWAAGQSVSEGFDLPIRLTIGFVALLPLGIPMGFLFPTGLHRVRIRGENFVPWAIGLNGVLSVVGSTLAVPLALLLGFAGVSLVAGVCYLVALFAFFLSRS